MKVKIRNLIEMILQAIIMVLVFIPGFNNWQAWYESSQYIPSLDRYVPTKTMKSESVSSLLISSFDADAILMVLGVVVCLSIVCGCVLFTLQFIAKGNKRNWILPLYAVVFEFVLFLMYSIFIDTSDYVISGTEYRVSLSFVFYIMLALFILLTSIALLEYMKAHKHGIIEETPKVYKTEIIQGTLSNADELKKYKDLLDSGIITQEEFDTKKKQLLGL